MAALGGRFRTECGLSPNTEADQNRGVTGKISLSNDMIFSYDCKSTYLALVLLFRLACFASDRTSDAANFQIFEALTMPQRLVE